MKLKVFGRQLINSCDLLPGNVKNDAWRQWQQHVSGPLITHMMPILAILPNAKYSSWSSVTTETAQLILPAKIRRAFCSAWHVPPSSPAHVLHTCLKYCMLNSHNQHTWSLNNWSTQCFDRRRSNEYLNNFSGVTFWYLYVFLSEAVDSHQV